MESENRVILPIYVSNVKTLADGSLNITIQTQELTPDQYAGLFRLHRTRGHALLSTSRVDNYNELDHLDAEAVANEKTNSLSQKQRAVIYRIWEQIGNDKSFKDFYKEYMLRIIEHLKSKLA